MSTSDIVRRFSRLVIRAYESPATVDRPALLGAAEAFLAVCRDDGAPSAELARTMACSAMEWVVIGGPCEHLDFKAAVRAYWLYVKQKA